MPDEEEKQILENNIQAAISQQSIDLDDAIDLRNVRNVKLANQLLKVKRKAKIARDQQIQQQNIQAQAQANAQQQQAAAAMEAQKTQAKTDADIRLEQEKNRLKTMYLQQEADVKKELMAYEFELNSQLKGMEREITERSEIRREDRKDDRVDRQAAHQKEMIDQRNSDNSLKKFESTGNDIVTGSAGIGRFGA